MMNQISNFSSNEIASGILLFLASIIYVIRSSVLVHLAIEMANTEVSLDVKSKRVYLSQLLLIASVLIGAASLQIGLTIPFPLIAVVFLAGMVLILLNTKRIFKKVERLAKLKRLGK